MSKKMVITKMEHLGLVKICILEYWTSDFYKLAQKWMLLCTQFTTQRCSSPMYILNWALAQFSRTRPGTWRISVGRFYTKKLTGVTWGLLPWMPWDVDSLLLFSCSIVHRVGTFCPKNHIYSYKRMFWIRFYNSILYPCRLLPGGAANCQFSSWFESRFCGFRPVSP